MSWESHPDRPRPGQPLCQLSDIPDAGGLEVAFGEGEENFRILLLREDQKYWCYLNRCPHFSLPLNYKPQKFIFADGMLVCAHHTAYFTINTGDCVDGPCKGRQLTPLPTHRSGEMIFFGAQEEASSVKGQAQPHCD